MHALNTIPTHLGFKVIFQLVVDLLCCLQNYSLKHSNVYKNMYNKDVSFIKRKNVVLCLCILIWLS